MIQKLLPKIEIVDLLFYTPVAIIVFTQFLPSNAILGLLSMLVVCTFPGYALLTRFKLHRSSRFQDLFFSVLLSMNHCFYIGNDVYHISCIHIYINSMMIVILLYLLYRVYYTLYCTMIWYHSIVRNICIATVWW